MLRDPAEAEVVASKALQSGALSRIGVLAHARHEALTRAGSVTPTSREDVAAVDVRDLAQQLTGTRPALERVIVDLESRYGLDVSSFARTLGLTNERALERSRAVGSAWADELDPAMMAWLGPGSCAELEQILSSRNLWPRPMNSGVITGEHRGLLATGTDALTVASPEELISPTAEPITIGDLLGSSPAVLDHSQVCPACSERLRMLTPVRALVNQLPPETVPTTVATAAHTSRRRLPGALPPSIEARRLDPRRIRWALIAATGLAALTIISVSVVRNIDDGESQADRVARLVESAPASRLLATPTVMTPDVRTAALANSGDVPILWHATSSAAWLRVSPADGRLAPNQSASVTVEATTTEPSEAVITFTGSDGSSQTIRYRTSN